MTNSCRNCGDSTSSLYHFTTYSYCSSCFITKFRKKFIKNIPKEIKGQNLGIAFSFGTDSLVLLDNLYYLRDKLKLTLVAITVDEGIPSNFNFRRTNLPILQKKYPEVIFLIKPLNNYYEHNLEELLKFNEKLDKPYTPCTICGVLRSHSINRIIQQEDISHITFGNNFDDELQTILINLLRGRVKKIEEEIEYYYDNERFPSRIKPLQNLSKNEIAGYHQLLELPEALTSNCPYEQTSLRFLVKKFLGELREYNSNLLFNLAKLSERREKTKVKINQCSSCGSFTNTEVCSACKMIKNILTG